MIYCLIVCPHGGKHYKKCEMGQQQSRNVTKYIYFVTLLK